MNITLHVILGCCALRSEAETPLVVTSITNGDIKTNLLLHGFLSAVPVIPVRAVDVRILVTHEHPPRATVKPPVRHRRCVVSFYT